MKHRTLLIFGLALAAVLLLASAVFAQDTAPTLAINTPVGTQAPGDGPAVVNPAAGNAGSNPAAGNNPIMQAGPNDFDDEPVITAPVLPSSLNRISWGAIIAGVIMALMIQ